jgi:hypothetical protein
MGSKAMRTIIIASHTIRANTISSLQELVDNMAKKTEENNRN